MTDPIVKYAGGKRWALPALRPLVLSNLSRRYVEPFVGGAALALSLSGPEYNVQVTVRDVEWDLIETYETCRYAPIAVARRLDEMGEEHTPERYYEVRASDPLRPIDRAARILYLNKMGFNGLWRKNRSGRFNVPIGRGKVSSLPSTSDLLAFSRATRHWRIEQGDFEGAVKLAGEGDVVYADPPYAGTFAYSSGFDADDRVRLRDSLDDAWERGSTVIATDSEAALEVWSGGSWTIERVSEPRRVSAGAAGRLPAECLLMHRSHR